MALLAQGSAVCGGNATSDCPYPDPAVSAARGHGVNYLFSAEDFNGPWTAEHSLLNTSSFVSCPEFFHLRECGTCTDCCFYRCCC
jgi:hypothetical protein|eukprot:COSAG06_NODE_10790_length_1615_cov_1.979551_2_plen_85_part_00